MRGKTIRIRAYAKINLELRVLGVGRDSYHELRTTFQTIDLHDTLTIRRTAGSLRLTCNDPACPIDESNLVWRAALLIWRGAGRRGVPQGAEVRIDKRIPTQAGLGGGSSDGAAALHGFAALWRVRLTRPRLQRYAKALGADVPFFLEGGAARGTGRGDRLERLPDHPRSWIALALPSFGVSTREAFGWWDAAAPTHAQRPPVLDMRERYGASANDLELVVAQRHPQIAAIVDALKRAGASDAAMSGSGSAVFALFSSRRAASRAAALIKSQDLRTLVTRTLARAEFRRLSCPVVLTTKPRKT